MAYHVALRWYAEMKRTTQYSRLRKHVGCNTFRRASRERKRASESKLHHPTIIFDSSKVRVNRFPPILGRWPCCSSTYLGTKHLKGMERAAYLFPFAYMGAFEPRGGARAKGSERWVGKRVRNTRARHTMQNRVVSIQGGEITTFMYIHPCCYVPPRPTHSY